MERSAKAHWSGNLKDGDGTLQTQSAALDGTPYSYNTRFGEEIGTNPEELLAAAHAGCFTMAVASAIEKAKHKADALTTECRISMEGLKITGAHLKITGTVQGMNYGEFENIVADMAKNCVISKALAVPITYESSF
ncbi:MAG: OsmC family peroxiredoxin [Bacteroidia bacterium]